MGGFARPRNNDSHRTSCNADPAQSHVQEGLRCHRNFWISISYTERQVEADIEPSTLAGMSFLETGDL